MPVRPLPARASLDHLKHQARDLMRAREAGELSALQRIREFHPRFRDASDEAIRGAKFTLADAQYSIAREYGMSSWIKLRVRVHSDDREREELPIHDWIEDPLFRHAVDLLDEGDSDGLRDYLSRYPQLVRQRLHFEGINYFRDPSLLNFVAENPIRNGRLPANIVEIAKIILEAGGKEDEQSINYTLALVISGRVPRKCGVQVPLIDLLFDYGARMKGDMGEAIVHGEFEAVEAMIRRGARVTLPVVAALGRLEEAKRLMPDATPEQRHLALAFAAQHGRAEVLRMLLEAGENPNRYNPPGTHSHSTPLHQAANAGHLEAVKILIEHGADPWMEDILWHGTPRGWAEYGGLEDVRKYLEDIERLKPKV